MDLISIVVPCYNEQETVPIFYKKLEEVKQKMPLSIFPDKNCTGIYDGVLVVRIGN